MRGFIGEIGFWIVRIGSGKGFNARRNLNFESVGENWSQQSILRNKFVL